MSCISDKNNFKVIFVGNSNVGKTAIIERAKD